MADAQHGRAVLRTYLNLLERPPSPSTAVFDATLRAGAATRLADRIRRFQRLSYEQVQTFGRLAAIVDSDLRDRVLPLLRLAGLVDYTVSADGTPGEISEQVAVGASLLEQCDEMWLLCQPSVHEAAAVQSAELSCHAPMARSDHQAALERGGFPERLHEAAISAASGAGLLYAHYSPRLGEDVLYSPYVWTTNALDIAEFFRALPANERDLLTAVSARAMQHPGVSEEHLGVSENLLRGARRVGLIDATRVQTSTNDERSFVFAPTLERMLTGGATDATHLRKLFTAHVLYGHRYGNPGTGRIDSPIALVNALVQNRTVKPSTAAGTDWLLVESAGIVRVERVGNMGRLHLVKDEVARDSLELLRLAVAEADGGAQRSQIWLPGTAFVTPERDRATLPDIQPSAEREALRSVVEQLRDELTRKVRGEEF